jgi:serine/threonine protein kinase
MELLERETLRERIASRSLDVATAQALAIQVADAVDAADGKGIIHRDIKPANIFVTRGCVEPRQGQSVSISDAEELPQQERFCSYLIDIVFSGTTSPLTVIKVRVFSKRRRQQWPSTVGMSAIKSTLDSAQHTGTNVLSRERSTGSGVVVSADGDIMTNAHVIAGARTIRVKVYGVSRRQSPIRGGVPIEVDSFQPLPSSYWNATAGAGSGFCSVAQTGHATNGVASVVLACVSSFA